MRDYSRDIIPGYAWLVIAELDPAIHAIASRYEGLAMLARIIILVMILFAAPVAWAQDSSDTLHDLLVQYRCPVVDRLERVYPTDDRTDTQDNFLIIDFPGHRQDYVQCVFDTRTKVLCEASSGYFYDSPDKPRTYRLPASAIAALGRMGFSTDDSAGNFRIWLDVADPPDFNRLADFMLRALYDGYGARANMNLQFSAPLAPHSSSKCIPVS